MVTLTSKYVFIEASVTHLIKIIPSQIMQLFNIAEYTSITHLNNNDQKLRLTVNLTLNRISMEMASLLGQQVD